MGGEEIYIYIYTYIHTYSYIHIYIYNIYIGLNNYSDNVFFGRCFLCASMLPRTKISAWGL